MTQAAHQAYLSDASARYQEAHDALGAAVRRVFPGAIAVFEHDMPAWVIPRPADAVRPERGTIDPTRVFVGLIERKSGLSVHLWDPGDYYLFDHHRDRLEEAGLRVMRGCLVHNRKAPFPVAAVEALLRAIRERDF